MSYLFRLTLLSSALFFLSYVFISSALAAFWPLIRRRAVGWNDRALYRLRIAPLVAASALVGFLVIPSFLFLEPLETREAMSIRALAFAFGGVVVVIAGTLSVLLACWRTARFVAACTKVEGLANTGFDSVAIEIPGRAPMLAVAGAYQPTIVVSRQLRRLLAPGEIQAAIHHELAHIHRHDNLKKLVLRFSRFPFLAGLERTWLNAAELAADDYAATSEVAAVDLASALLKVASASGVSRLPDLAISLVPETDGALRVRVERLLSWKPPSGEQSSVSDLWRPAVLAVLPLVLGYSPLLRQVHELTELFIR